MAGELSRLPAGPLRSHGLLAAGALAPPLHRVRALASDPLLSRTPEVAISICLLEYLRREGPFAPVFRDVRDPGRPVDWLGRARQGQREGR